jgi:hypothetical protein
MSKIGSDSRKYVTRADTAGSTRTCGRARAGLRRREGAQISEEGGRSVVWTQGAGGRRPLPELLISARASFERESELTSRRALNLFTASACSPSVSLCNRPGRPSRPRKSACVGITSGSRLNPSPFTHDHATGVHDAREIETNAGRVQDEVEEWR